MTLPFQLTRLTILSFSSRCFPTPSSLLPTRLPGWCFCASPAAPPLQPLVGVPLSSNSGLLSLHCTPLLSSPFHYPGVSHYLKIGNSWIFKLSFGSLSYAPDSYIPLLQVQQTQHEQKALSVLCAQGTPSVLKNGIELCSCVCKSSQGFNSHSPCHI